jgi:hypothetical protein
MAKPKITNKGKIPPISDRLQARFSRVTDKSGGRHIRRFCRLKLDKLVLEKDLYKEEKNGQSLFRYQLYCAKMATGEKLATLGIRRNEKM